MVLGELRRWRIFGESLGNGFWRTDTLANLWRMVFTFINRIGPSSVVLRHCESKVAKNKTVLENSDYIDFPIVVKLKVDLPLLKIL